MTGIPRTQSCQPWWSTSTSSMTYEERSQRRAAEIAGPLEALSILSESALLHRRQILHRVTIHQHETMSSNVPSVKDAIEDVAAKIASTIATLHLMPVRLHPLTRA